MQTRRKTPWLPLGIGLTVALASAFAYFKLHRKSPPPLPTVTNSLDMKFVQVPAGTFLMGSPTTEPQRQDDETEHEVEITRPFYLGTTEVTQGQYRQVMGSNPSVLPGAKEPRWLEYAVDNVSWNEAVAFCKKLSALPEEKAAGRSYRLPTEAEWEYACRAGSTTAFAFGNQLTARQANLRPLKNLGKIDPSQCVRTSPMLSACTPCTAASGNGAATGTARTTTRKAPSRIRRGRARASSGWPAAAPGPTTRGTAARLGG